MGRAKKYKLPHASAKLLKTMMEDMQLCDIWRLRNPEKRRYSWYCKKPVLTASRLDYFLINAGMTSSITNVEYTVCHRTDHSLNYMCIQNDDFKRGPGTWKFNVKLLKNEMFVDKIKKEIALTVDECDAMQEHIFTKWECVKRNCTRVAKEFSKNSSKKKNELYKNLLLFLDEARTCEIEGKPVKQETQQLVTQKIKELENEKVQSSAFRAKCQWYQAGERSSKYFFALEKRSFNNKTMFAVKLPTGELCKEMKRILTEQEKFYRTLYTSDMNVKFTLENSSGVQLSNEQQTWLDRDLEMREIEAAINDMKTGKVPGCDGLPIEFYISFKEEIKGMLLELFNEIRERQEMTRSMKRGIMSLLPKRNKNSTEIRNLKPLTLLASDYKILAKIMANRLKKVLPSIIGEQQTGFMAGRHIDSNIRKTMDVVSSIYQSKGGIKAVVVCIDFEKCFDRIEHQSIFAALRYFNFGSNYIN